jgi:hypothetical protein
MLFRALGIPARYTVGFAGEVKAGAITEIGADKAHAWVDVYVNGIGWVNVEVTGGGAATGADKPLSLTITPDYTGDVYDSTVYNEYNPLLPKQSVGGFKTLSELGYKYDVRISGENGNIGIVKTAVEQFRIYDPFGELVYDKESGLGKEKFNVTFKEGTLQLYYSHLYFTSSSESKTYDGIASAVMPEDCKMTGGELLGSYRYEIYNGISKTGVGKYAATFKVRIYDEYGNECDDYYRISTSYGQIVIEAREISVKASDATKPYDGSALTSNEIEYDKSSLAEDDYIAEYVLSGSQTNVGKCSNVIKSIIIRNKNGEDVTANYIIRTSEGVLTVTLP